MPYALPFSGYILYFSFCQLTSFSHLLWLLSFFFKNTKRFPSYLLTFAHIWKCNTDELVSSCGQQGCSHLKFPGSDACYMAVCARFVAAIWKPCYCVLPGKPGDRRAQKTVFIQVWNEDGGKWWWRYSDLSDPPFAVQKTLSGFWWGR